MRKRDLGGILFIYFYIELYDCHKCVLERKREKKSYNVTVPLILLTLIEVVCNLMGAIVTLKKAIIVKKCPQ